MSRFLTITHSNSVTFGERKRTINKPTAQIGKVSLNFLLAVLICAMGVIYIYEVNRLAVQGYEIKKMEKDLQKLKDKNEMLRIQEAESRSMYNIEQSSKELNMTVPKDISYLTLPGNMAMK